MGATVGKEAQEVSPAKAKKGDKKGSRKGAKSAATASRPSDAAPEKKRVRKKAAASGEGLGRKTATKKVAARSKVSAGRKRKSSQAKAPAESPVHSERPVPRQGAVERATAGARATSGSPPASAEALPGDPNSLSWMAAQAARALNAVKAAQAEQAAAERASHKLVDAAENLRLAETLASESAQTEAGRSRGEALAATPPVPEAGETSGAADNVVAFTLSESPAPVEADAEERPVPAPVHERPERGAPGAALAVLPRHELIAAAPIPRRSRLRPMLLVGLVVVVGLLAYRHWDIGQDATPATAPATAELRTGQGGEVPASVPVPPVRGTASPAPSRLPAKPLPATPVLPAGPGAEPEQTGEAAVAVSRENANPPRQDLMPAVAAPAPQTQTARSENAETRPKAPEVAASTESSPRQAGAPPPRYGPPGYGYYPPPGSWPRYYGPGYRQPPSR